jgi:DNA adenine methylase
VLYLNRTNRSGVLNAGVIGGQKQEGTYTVGSRFYRETLLSRLDRIHQLSSRITVTAYDGLAAIREYAKLTDAFFYIDPPYFDKGSYLYLNSFKEDDHTALAELLGEYRDRHWILTYDDVPRIRELFSAFRHSTYALNYSAHKVELKQELIVFSDHLSLEA